MFASVVEVVRINAKVVLDDSGVFTEIPVLLDQNKEPVKPLIEYALKLKRDGMSQSTISNYIKQRGKITTCYTNIPTPAKPIKY